MFSARLQSFFIILIAYLGHVSAFRMLRRNSKVTLSMTVDWEAVAAASLPALFMNGVPLVAGIYIITSQSKAQKEALDAQSKAHSAALMAESALLKKAIEAQKEALDAQSKAESALLKKTIEAQKEALDAQSKAHSAALTAESALLKTTLGAQKEALDTALISSVNNQQQSLDAYKSASSFQNQVFEYVLFHEYVSN